MLDVNMAHRLREAAGAAPYKFLLCSKCDEMDAIEWKFHESYGWALNLQCISCNLDWSICTECVTAQSTYKPNCSCIIMDIDSII